MADHFKRNIVFSCGRALLTGTLAIPEQPKGLVLFAHGSGSSRFSSRNQFVAKFLNDHSIGTCLVDLLTQKEDVIDETTRKFRFDIDLLADRLIQITDSIRREKSLPIAYFGASTGAAAALIAAAKKGSSISSVVSRGGRPDLANRHLRQVQSPTLLIVGSKDTEVIALNQQAYELLECPKKLAIVPGATHLFEEPGCLEKVAELSGQWFTQHFPHGQRDDF